jgi:D-alanyl-D-alanine-carboxypeptidase/D-alanyl-D-alanine-endopeptidase
MRVRLGLWWAALVCGLVAGYADCLAQAPTVPEDVVTSVHARVDHGYNVGIVVGIVNPQGTTYYGYGKTAISGDEHPNELTVFEIGSITKVFTSILLADMVERGEVALDDPIERYLPDSVTVPTRNGRSITLEDLATQTSGLPRMPNNFAPADAANPYADYSVQQMYDFLSNHTLQRDIGAQYEYSNYAVGLLGHILTLRAGMSYEELVEERIADVLGMPDTRITLTPEMRSRLAVGHSGSQEVANWDIPTLAGAGALRSTARDMLVFIAANLGLAETPLRAALEMTHEARHEAGSPQMHIGLGWHIRTAGDHEVIWHNGGTGGYRSFAGFVRETGTGVVVLTNTNMSADDIGLHLLDASVPLREIRIPVEVDPAVFDQYVGRYELAPGAIFDVTVDDGRLFVQLTGQPRFQVYPESETEFFLTVVDAQLTFVRDESGQVTAVILHQGGIDQTAKRLP